MKRVESKNLDELLLRDEIGKQIRDLLFHWPRNILSDSLINSYNGTNNLLLSRRVRVKIKKLHAED